MTPPVGRTELPNWAREGAARIDTDRDGFVVAWNHEAEVLYGYSSLEAVGESIAKLLVPVSGQRHAAEIMEAVALGRCWEGEFDVRHRDGRVIRVLVHDAPSYGRDGELSGVVGHSILASDSAPFALAVGAGRDGGWWTRSLMRAIFDPSVGVGLRMRLWLISGGVALESLWALVARWAGPEQSVGIAGAVAVLGVLAIAIADTWAGVAVACISGVVFVVVVGYSAWPASLGLGVTLVAVWAVSALAAGIAAVRLRAQAQRGVVEAVALHRELVGSLVPSPRLRRVDVSVAALYRPGERRLELGGDFYAATERADKSVALLVGDVSGHGPAAAALAAMLRAGWEALVEAGLPPEVRLQSLNRLLLEHAQYEEFFATVCSVVINPRLTEATITLAGHPPPILTHGGVLVPLELPIGMPLGVEDAAHWTPARVALPEAFSLLLYTDGVIEGRAQGLPGERFGEQRLIDLVTATSSGGRELLQQILHSATDAHGGPLPDDAALLLLQRGPTVGGTVRPPASDRLQA